MTDKPKSPSDNPVDSKSQNNKAHGQDGGMESEGLNPADGSPVRNESKKEVSKEKETSEEEKQDIDIEGVMKHLKTPAA